MKTGSKSACPVFFSPRATSCLLILVMHRLYWGLKIDLVWLCHLIKNYLIINTQK